MIVPMKKVSLVVLDKRREESLEKLREIGVVHLERKNVSSDSLTKLLDRKAKIENVLNILRPFEEKAKNTKKPAPQKTAALKTGVAGKAAVSLTAAIPPKETPRRRASDFINSVGVPFSTEAVDAPDRSDLILHILEAGEERKFLQERTNILSREKSRMEGWGYFNFKDLEFLKENGIIFNLYEIPAEKFLSLPSDIPFIITGRDKSTLRIAVLDKEVPGESPFLLGEHSLGEIEKLLSDMKGQIENIDNRLVSLTSRKPVIESELKTLLKKIEFETANSGMEHLDEVPEEFTVSWLSGFVPSEDVGRLKRAAAENSWALLSEDPGEEDEVPTKLKNNRLTSLLYPLTNFLEVMPGYNEADISGWFLLFFTIFFGMIFGDAAYGAIFVIASIIGIIINLKKGVPAIFKLILLLGSSNFIWGILTCTWFGIDSQLLPEFLKNISLPLISNVTSARSEFDAGIVQQNLMIFCFTLALLQLSIGHIIAITRTRSLKILADLGAIAMLIGMYGLVLSLIASNASRQIPLLMPCVYLLGGGFVVNFIFANYDGSIGKSVLEGFKNIISMILGIANVFSDIMSYIRLWAVGLAGAAISSTVNQMAGPLLGHFIFFILAVVLLVFGHGLNLVLNALSVLVHGVRLNTLEFSSHVGLNWAGNAYKPFKEKE
ncbi:MAG: V-type ATP synthase subunit I [Treponema sp.]|nr:V-type ATP synthase subunit I [Treponema sp.]